ncbi:MAG: zf-HC2 domain-containing protein [Actinobacteria bacterium]|nr:zf-HC2 domain-containing protein [Actinomycetota bacterium]
MTLHPEMAHERCSELLGPLVRGRLTPADTAAVEGHLSGCADCVRELEAVSSLLGAPVEAMDDLERTRLRAGIAGGLRHVVPVADPYVHPDQDDGAPPNLRRASRRRVQPGAWLGVAAATLILFAGALTYLGAGGFVAGGSDQGGAGRSAQSTEGGAGGGIPGARAPDAGEAGVSDRPQMTQKPLIVRGGTKFTEEALSVLGRQAPSFRAFAGVHGPDDVPLLQGRYARSLERGLRGGPVEPCLDQAIEKRPGSLPAYGALGALRGGRVLVLGFVLPSTRSGADRFEVTWWAVGDPGPAIRCPQPLGHARGAIGDGESR